MLKPGVHLSKIGHREIIIAKYFAIECIAKKSVCREKLFCDCE